VIHSVNNEFTPETFLINSGVARMHFPLSVSVEKRLTLVDICGQVLCAVETRENRQQTPTVQESRIYLLVWYEEKKHSISSGSVKVTWSTIISKTSVGFMALGSDWLASGYCVIVLVLISWGVLNWQVTYCSFAAKSVL